MGAKNEVPTNEVATEILTKEKIDKMKITDVKKTIEKYSKDGLNKSELKNLVKIKEEGETVIKTAMENNESLIIEVLATQLIKEAKSKGTVRDKEFELERNSILGMTNSIETNAIGNTDYGKDKETEFNSKAFGTGLADIAKKLGDNMAEKILVEIKRQGGNVEEEDIIYSKETILKSPLLKERSKIINKRNRKTLEDEKRLVEIKIKLDKIDKSLNPNAATESVEKENNGLTKEINKYIETFNQENKGKFEIDPYYKNNTQVKITKTYKDGKTRFMYFTKGTQNPNMSEILGDKNNITLNAKKPSASNNFIDWVESAKEYLK